MSIQEAFGVFHVLRYRVILEQERMKRGIRPYDATYDRMMFIDEIMAEIGRFHDVLTTELASDLDSFLNYFKKLSVDDRDREVALKARSVLDIVKKKHDDVAQAKKSFDLMPLSVADFLRLLWVYSFLPDLNIDLILGYFEKNLDELKRFCANIKVASDLSVLMKRIPLSSRSIEIFSKMFSALDLKAVSLYDLEMNFSEVVKQLYRHKVIDFTLEDLLSIFLSSKGFLWEHDRELLRKIAVFHIWEIQGMKRSDLAQNCVGIKEMSMHFMILLWSNFVETFLRERTGIPDSTLAKMLFAVRRAPDLYKSHSADMIKEEVQRNECLIIPVQMESALCIWMIFYKDRFLLCNCGKYVGVKSFKDQDNLQTERGVNNIVITSRKYNYPSDFNVRVLKSFGAIELERCEQKCYSPFVLSLQETIQLPPPPEGMIASKEDESSWSNAMAAFLGLLVLFNKSREDITKLYKQFLVFSRERIRNLYCDFPYEKKDEELIKMLNSMHPKAEDFVSPDWRR